MELAEKDIKPASVSLRWRVRVIEIFKAALITSAESLGLTVADRVHLRRWSDDDRADEEWQTIDRAVQKRGLLLPPNVFINEMLATRRVAQAIASRGKYRDRYRKYANMMEEIAKFLRKPNPAGMPPTLPRSEELARRLDEAARISRMEVDPKRDVPNVVKVGRQSRTPTIFINQTSNYLKDITGQWMDEQVAVLTEITFERIGDVDPEHVKWLRRKVGHHVPVGKPSR